MKKAYASQESIGATLTVSEMRASVAQCQPHEGERLRDGTDARIVRAMSFGWRSCAELQEVQRTVYLLLPGEIVVKGWLSTRFRSRPVSFWTWDQRFARELADGRTVPGVVGPLAWCPIEEAAAA